MCFDPTDDPSLELVALPPALLFQDVSSATRRIVDSGRHHLDDLVSLVAYLYGDGRTAAASAQHIRNDTLEQVHAVRDAGSVPP